MERKESKIGVFIILITYLVGVLGFLYLPLRPIFLWMVPFHLLLVFFIILIFHSQYNFNFAIFFAISYSITFLAELIGIHTSKLFGSYYYGSVLGKMLWDVPLIIGINWTMLIYSAYSITSYFGNHLIIRSLLTASVLVLLDVAIEPVAIKLGFWFWNTSYIPIYNYVCWFILGFLISLCAHRLKVATNVPIGGAILFSQLVFFLSLNLFMV